VARSSKPSFAEFFSTLQKVASYHANYNSRIKKWWSPSSFLSYKRSKLRLRVFLAGHIVAMVTICVTNIMPTYSLVIGQFSDTVIVALIDKGW